MPLTTYQIEQLDEAIRAYSFPAVYFDFKNNREYLAPSMLAVEKIVGSKLRSLDIDDVKFGLANVLYWGYSQIGYGITRVNIFLNNITIFQLDDFQELLVGNKIPRLADVKHIQMPQYSGMSFISKVLMFLDPAKYCVLDQKIALLRTQSSPKALNRLVFRPKDTQIRISRYNEAVYDKWRDECMAISSMYFQASYRAVDIERGFFELIQHGDLSTAQTIYNNS
jgi:hypothetical protein